MILPTRTDAGRKLGAALARYAGQDTVVLALSPGGARVAYEVARRLGAPLDMLPAGQLRLPRKLRGVLGAIAPGVSVLGGGTEQASFPPAYLDSLIALERTELEARARGYRNGQPPISLEGRTAILVDDGLAEPLVVQAAARAIRKAGASRVVFAAATCGRVLRQAAEGEVQQVVVLGGTANRWSAPICDEGFAQTTASEVGELIRNARASAAFGLDMHEPLSERRGVDRRRHLSQPAGRG